MNIKDGWTGELERFEDDLDIEIEEDIWVNSASLTLGAEYVGYDEGVRYHADGSGTPPSGGYAHLTSIEGVDNISVSTAAGVELDHSQAGGTELLIKMVKAALLKEGYLDKHDDWASETVQGMLVG